jgi:hypothetical protein
MNAPITYATAHSRRLTARSAKRSAAVTGTYRHQGGRYRIRIATILNVVWTSAMVSASGTDVASAASNAVIVVPTFAPRVTG